jgi:hypothetical protein
MLLVELYAKVWINHINNKEIFIKPQDCDDFCLGKKHDHDHRGEEDEQEEEEIKLSEK